MLIVWSICFVAIQQKQKKKRKKISLYGSTVLNTETKKFITQQFKFYISLFFFGFIYICNAYYIAVALLLRLRLRPRHHKKKKKKAKMKRRKGTQKNYHLSVWVSLVKIITHEFAAGLIIFFSLILMPNHGPRSTVHTVHFFCVPIGFLVLFLMFCTFLLPMAWVNKAKSLFSYQI